MSRNNSQEEILRRCQDMHGDKYDYSLMEYSGYKNNIKIICKKHGPFEQRASHHIDGSGCQKCAAEKLSDKFSYRWTQKELKLLKELYYKVSTRECAKVLNKDINTINKQLEKLGIKRKNLCKPPPTHPFLPSFVFRVLKDSAESRGLLVDITEEDIWNRFQSQDKKCALTNWPISFNKKSKDTTASIDRINSSKAYTKDNIQIIHKYINTLKQNFSEEFLIQAAKAIYLNNKSKETIRDFIDFANAKEKRII